MADLNDLSKPDNTSRYDTEILQTLRGHISRLWSGDYTGMANLVAGMRRWVRNANNTDVKLVQRNAQGGEDTLFDSSNKGNLSGGNDWNGNQSFKDLSKIRWELNSTLYVQEISTNSQQNAYVQRLFDASGYIFKINSSDALKIDQTGNITSSGGLIGYGAGAGGSAQATLSLGQSNLVLNKPSGVLNISSTNTFVNRSNIVVNNSFVSDKDLVLINVTSAYAYGSSVPTSDISVRVTPYPGFFYLTWRLDASSMTSVNFQFAIIKGSTT